MANDGTGSIDVYVSSAASKIGSYVPAVGDAVEVNGTYSPYHQLPELSGGTISTGVNTSGPGTFQPSQTTMTTNGDVGLNGAAQTLHNNYVPGPTVTTIAGMLGQPGEGNLLSGGTSGVLPFSVTEYLLQLDDVTLSNVVNGTTPATTWTNYSQGNLTGTITDATGSVNLYDWPTSYSSCASMAGQPIPTGPVDMTGFVSVYPGSPAEFTPISVTAVPEPGTLVLLCPAWPWRQRDTSAAGSKSKSIDAKYRRKVYRPGSKRAW